MSRPKSSFLPELAERAKEDLAQLDRDQVVQKLRAIIAAASHPLSTVAEILGVSQETIWRWAKAYEKNGVDGLRPAPKKPKPSKLSPDQKKLVLGWIDNRKDPSGKDIHWTLERLRQSIQETFQVTLGINTIWVWLRKEGRTIRVPRPRHAKGDPKDQEDYKKNSPNSR